MLFFPTFRVWWCETMARNIAQTLRTKAQKHKIGVFEHVDDVWVAGGVVLSLVGDDWGWCLDCMRGGAEKGLETSSIRANDRIKDGASENRATKGAPSWRTHWPKTCQKRAHNKLTNIPNTWLKRGEEVNQKTIANKKSKGVYIDMS